jgi:hypothetical protein
MTAAQWNVLKDADERIWLFKPGPKMIDNRHVQSYLKFGLNGGCELDNQKISIRKPWFRCLDLNACDGFMSGMSATMPTLSLRAMPNLSATNTLYAVRFLDETLKEQHRLGIAMSLLLTDVRAQMKAKGRPYAAGLLKHEPCDLLGLMVPNVGEMKVTWRLYRRAILALKQGDEVQCSSIADSCLC